MSSDLTEIIRVFSTEIDRELTIHQISKLIKKSYAYTHKEVRNMISTGILKKKIVGNAILCSLDYTNDETIALLALTSAKGLGEKKEEYKDMIKTLKEVVVYSVFSKGKNVVIVCEDEFRINEYIPKLPTGYEYNVIDKEKFKLNVSNEDLAKQVIFGFENFWKMISEVVR